MEHVLPQLEQSGQLQNHPDFDTRHEVTRFVHKQYIVLLKKVFYFFVIDVDSILKYNGKRSVSKP